MLKLSHLALALALAAGGVLAQDKPPASSGAMTSKFGFVNTERILRDAAPAQRAQKKIEAEFQKRDQELARLAD
jgi:outer membrane protein